MAPPALRVLLARLAPPALRVPWALPVLLAPPARRVLLARLAPPALRVLWALPVPLDPPVRRGPLARLVPLDPRLQAYMHNYFQGKGNCPCKTCSPMVYYPRRDL